jgi:uncharacterized protein involved in exopolysaccharide biosynthesis
MESFEDEAPAGLGSLESLRDPRGILRRRWRAMLIAFLCGLVATAAAAWLVKPVYEARASVMIASQKLSADFVRPTIQEDPIERINALTSEVLSNQSLSELIEEHDLYPNLLERAGMQVTVAALRRKIRIEMDSGIKFDPGESARVVLVNFQDEDADRAAKIANDLATRLTVAGIRLRSHQARITTEFMRRELEAAETALREQTKKVSEFQGEHRGELPSELESSLRRLERLQQQRNSLALQVAEGETRLATLRAAEVVPASPRSRLVELKAQLARELSVNREAHPNVISLRREIALLEKELGGMPEPGTGVSAGRRAISEAAQRELDQLREQLAETDHELVDLDAKVARIPTRAQELDALAQREAVLRENYLEFSRKLKDAELAESLERAQQGERVSILDPALPPDAPKRPRWQIALAGLAGATGLALALGVLLEWRDPLIVTAEALEAAGRVPVLGSLPHVTARS